MKPVFPATYSTLCPIALSSLISAKYRLENVQCKFLLRGVGDTYLVEASEAKFILRVYRSSHRSLPQIGEEVKLLQALKETKVSVSYPITDILGESIQKIEAVEGERYAVLFSFARGQVVRSLSENQLRVLGNEMARFHHTSSTVSLGGERWTFDLETTVFKPLEKLRPVFKENAGEYSWLCEMAHRIEQKLSQIDPSVFSKGYCHFDFLPKNFHFENDSVTFFDFDFMGYGWLVNDIMTFWQHLILDVYTGRMTPQAAHDSYRIFLDGYRLIRPVEDEELALVPYLSLGFWLFYMGFHTSHDQFSVFSQPAHLNFYTAFLKHIVENYWDKC
ncbi:phosphotransferase enzyme family protein [Sphingobacterium detergens]|uniref:Ser/Thr protein kinase RdoA (MazF antagonist) n=1 Tax=Sphingobacterium detergens TaxID=1145106 RepID=A0A420BKW9_SPHD1|nr:phosphotransferase [Sphingobacterium detergens]RKE57337.1 Ser/Thr protein kinase RdoA (MazF antagonist) [Sphingobacterium detergens]